MNRTSFVVRGAAALALAAAAPALAQNEARTDALKVTATPVKESLTVPNPAEAKRLIERIPGGVDLVPDSEFRDSKATTIKDALDFVPGVFVQSKYGQQDSRLSIRGSGLSHNNHLRGALILIDGVLNNRTDPFGDTQEIDPLSTRYVEVYKGANGLQYGAATLGGVLNFVSPTGRDAPKLLARGQVGSFDTQVAQLAASHVVGPWDMWASPTFTHTEGFRDHSNGTYARLNGNVGFRPNETVETRFFLGYNNIDQRIPGALTRSLAYSAPTFTPAANYSLDTKRDQTSIRLANRTMFLVGDHEATLSAYFKDKNLFHPLTFAVIDQQTQDYGVTSRLTGEGRVAGLRAGFVVGSNLAYGVNRGRQFANVGGHRGALQNDVDEMSWNLTGYGEGRLWVLPDLALVGGAQVNQARRELDDNFLSNGDDSGRKNFTSVNPKIGVLWEPEPALQVFANLNRSTEPPTFGELNPSATPGFADLDAQKAWTAEIGTRGELLGGRIAFDLTAYRAWVKDELQLFVVAGSGAGGFAVNADKTIHQGIEAGVTVDLLRGLFVQSEARDRLSTRIAYTLGDFRFDNDPSFGDNELPGAPRHLLRGELRYSHPLGFYVAPNVEWVPRGYFVDNANTRDLKTRPYALLGLKVGFDYPEAGLSFFVDARNLLDKTYVSNTAARPVALATDSLYNPGDGHAVYVGIEVRW
ncbi:TonB-dependent receptor family protein [Desertibaculum subflavum]|uniref:TonB-dependent receptor family protein n=1 Tax=Desertibaculum subflavum TaxID=2268458 RepID=UPI0013C48924